MVVHASTHLSDEGDAPAAQLCDFCAVSNTLQNMAGGCAMPDVAANPVPDHAVEAAAAPQPPAAAFTAFRSRAPPILL